MKLYREVKTSGGCLTFYTPRGVPIHLEPIEITEEEIAAVLAEHISYAAFAMNDTSTCEIAEVILSKLKNE